MTLPDAPRIYAVIAATWPAALVTRVGPWTIRDGQGGGSRVSAATADGPFSTNDLPQAEQAMRDLGQTPQFMIRAGDKDLDTLLAAAGYEIKDPVTLYAAPVGVIATERPKAATSFLTWPPLAAQREVWEDGEIGASRLAVMARAPHPKTTILSRADDRCAGSTFVGIDGDCSMIHALEIGAHFRRRGLARETTIAAAFWAKAQGATYLTLVTTDANEGANALYTSLGMQVVGHYHYRISPKG